MPPTSELVALRRSHHYAYPGEVPPLNEAILESECKIRNGRTGAERVLISMKVSSVVASRVTAN